MGGRLGYLLTLSRPRFWFYLAGPVLVGAAYGAGSVAELLAPLPLALFAYFLLPANVLLYGVNDAFDTDTDVHNPKKDGRETRYRGGPFVRVALAVSGLLGLGLFAAVPRVSWLPLAGFFALAVGYSSPPVRFKARPFLDSLSNGLYALPGVVAYAALAGELPPAAALAGAWAWTMGMHTFSAIPDIKPDREAGIETTATVLGERRTYAYVAGCWVVAAVCFGLLGPLAGALLAVYPVFVAGVALTEVAVERAYWWFPALNTVVGGVLTVGGLWGLVHG
jgi:4-hydroxybenzoate polyprenyltransferase